MNEKLFWLFLGAGTAFILWFTWWASVQEKRYHGLVRFFAFESLLLLILLKAPVWFVRPFSPLQTASWFFLGASLALAAHGFYLLKRLGRPQGKFENTSMLVREGAYRIIRHPLYGSLLLFGIGAFLKGPSQVTVLLLLVNTLALLLTAKVEEGEMLARFGDEYRAYCQKTRMFIPYIL